MSVTLTYLGDLSRVRIEAEGLAGTHVAVERSLNNLIWSTVRGGLAVPVQVGNEIVNPGFETDTAGWAATRGTITRDTAQAQDGAASARYDSDTAQVGERFLQYSDRVDVTAGGVYSFSAWVLQGATFTDGQLTIAWYDAVGAFISSTGGPTITLSAAWQQLQMDATAPAGAAAAEPRVVFGPDPGATAAHAFADTATFGNGRVSLDDYEFGSDQVNYYRVRPLDVVEGFEDAALDIEIGDGGSDKAWLRTDDHAAFGAWSLGSGAIVDAQTSDAVVTVPAAAAALRFHYRVSSEDGFDFFRFLIDSTQQFEDSGEVDWTLSDGHDVSAAATVTFRYAKDTSVLGGEDRAYVDEVVFSGFPQQTAQITPSLAGRVWLKNVGYPLLNTELDDWGMSPKQRAARAGVFPISGRVLPTGVTDHHLGRQVTLNVVAATDEDAARLDVVLAAGGTVFLHVPPTLDVVPGGYYLVGDSADRALSEDVPASQPRVFEMPLTEVEQPGPDIVGATLTWATLLRLYGSWEALLAAHQTWRDAFATVGDPEDAVTF